MKIRAKNMLTNILTVVAAKNVWAYNSLLIWPTMIMDITVKKVSPERKINITQNFGANQLAWPV
jgi:hypothetical protein